MGRGEDVYGENGGDGMSGCRISKVKFKDGTRELKILPPPPYGRNEAMRGVLDVFSAHGGDIASMAIVVMDKLNQTTSHYVLHKGDATALIGGLHVLNARLLKHELGLIDE